MLQQTNLCNVHSRQCQYMIISLLNHFEMAKVVVNFLFDHDTHQLHLPSIWNLKWQMLIWINRTSIDYFTLGNIIVRVLINHSFKDFQWKCRRFWTSNLRQIVHLWTNHKTKNKTKAFSVYLRFKDNCFLLSIFFLFSSGFFLLFFFGLLLKLIFDLINRIQLIVKFTCASKSSL